MDQILVPGVGLVQDAQRELRRGGLAARAAAVGLEARGRSRRRGCGRRRRRRGRARRSPPAKRRSKRRRSRTRAWAARKAWRRRSTSAVVRVLRAHGHIRPRRRARCLARNGRGAGTLGAVTLAPGYRELPPPRRAARRARLPAGSASGRRPRRPGRARAARRLRRTSSGGRARARSWRVRTPARSWRRPPAGAVLVGRPLRPRRGRPGARAVRSRSCATRASPWPTCSRGWRRACPARSEPGGGAARADARGGGTRRGGTTRPRRSARRRRAWAPIPATRVERPGRRPGPERAPAAPPLPGGRGLRAEDPGPRAALPPLPRRSPTRRARTRTWPALAWEAGYADQPHLTRECTRLTGLAPAALARARRAEAAARGGAATAVQQKRAGSGVPGGGSRTPV